MSHTHPTASSSSRFQLIINNALDKYKKRTKNDLLAHPLAAQLQSCDSPSAILAIIQQQVQRLDQSRSSDERWSRWLDPTVNVLYTLSATVGAGVGLVFSPSTVIFTGIGVLLSAAKDTRASQDALIDIFERIQMFFQRLEIYTEVPLTMEMTDIIIQIMAEVISILGITTKYIKQSRIKKYLKKLMGRTEIEDALKRLDKLTQEEARMAAAENLRVAHVVDQRVENVADMVVVIDNRVAGVDVRVAGVDDRVAGVGDLVQQTANDVDEVKRNQLLERIRKLRESSRKWLSAPDPSTNHNIACGTHHKKKATWFFQGRVFQGWKSTGSLLWIHGKPGSGKSVICSTLIQDIEAMCEAGQASMAYFYFDFRDDNKKGLHDLVSSLLNQLSACSDPRCDILSDLYLAHDNGNKRPNDISLVECLKQILTLPDQLPTYLIIDALDESPNASGILSSREMVLQLLKELVDLSLPDLHLCVTSRPEIDIRNYLEPLTSRRVSLHDQSGQKEDIADYVRSVVYSDSQQIMRRWKTEDKELVIHTLSERADGMFRWAFCQLETLRHCLPPSVRRNLDELPESLDGTYERVLKEIKRPNRNHARRLLQCLVVAVRPLDVKELAEVLAIDFDDAEGIPRLKSDWRSTDQEHALLTSCSSLITIVKTYSSRVVQFSHFSVKEFLTSERLATLNADVSHYHVDLKPAHTILAQACLGILLQPDDREENGIEKRSPLAGYAARYWVTHAQLKSESSFLRKAMEYLFDLDMPYFAAWLQLHDIDTRPDPRSSLLHLFTVPTKSSAIPLYYAALCGFQNLVGHLIAKCPQDVNTSGGYYVTPLVAALAGRHFHTVKLLHHNGAHVNIRGNNGETPLVHAASYGDLEIVQVLLHCKADANARGRSNRTPLLNESQRSRLPVAPHNLSQLVPNVTRLSLEHGANLNVRINRDLTPLYVAVEHGKVEVVRVLLEHGANVGMGDDEGRTPLHVAAGSVTVEVVRMLLEHGANVGKEDDEGRTPLHLAADCGTVEVVRVLLEHGAIVGAEDDEGTTPFQILSAKGDDEIMKLLR